ncbi:hypothetical protein FBY30_0169 [Arthrobacter sp. SLBN-83]|uniref:hypothetical protein n=1 Tax=Arthrobacter sp. SLBN-83 TaxID=2768449 RepID=UPI001166E0D6|nr:hypothetical protein [Arthrobacter sp. SLBN-83]TQJ57968.1 hypothetical protein FBY30_0169 [Arthrobacter sp. SLBN-83]
MQQNRKAPDPDEDPVSHVDLTQSPEEVLEYWTKERMAEAKPREICLPEPGSRPADQD